MANIKKLDSSDGRYYEIEIDGEIHKLVSVTTVINSVMNKPALVPWAFNIGVEEAMGLVAEDAARAIKDGREEEFALALSAGAGVPMKDRLRTTGRTHDSRREDAAYRGTFIHSLLEGRIKEQKGEFFVPLDVEPGSEAERYLDSLDKFIKDYDPEWHESELTVFSLTHGYAGTLDAVCTIRKQPKNKRHKKLISKKVILDLKTGKDGRVYPESHFPQLSAYKEAYYESTTEFNQIDESIVLAIGPENYSVGVNYFEPLCFNAILDVYNMMQRCREANPNKRK